MSRAANAGTAPGAVAQTQAGNTGLSAGLAVPGAPSSDASGPPCRNGGSVTSSMHVYTNTPTWSASGNQAHAAAGLPPPPLPPPVYSYPRIDGVALKGRLDPTISSLLAEHIPATDPAQCTFSSQVPSPSSVTTCIPSGVTAQQTHAAISSAAPDSISLGHLYPHTPAQSFPPPPPVCSAAPPSGQTISLTTRKYSWALDGCLPGIGTQSKQSTVLQSGTIPAPNSSSSDVRATNATGSTHLSATAATAVIKHNDLTKTFAAPAVRRLPVPAAFPAIAATLSGRSGANSAAACQVNSSAVCAHRFSSFKIPLSAAAAPPVATVAAATASSSTPAAGIAVTGQGSTVLVSSIVDSRAPASTRRDCDAEVASVQQQEHGVRTQGAQAAEVCSSTAKAGNPKQNVSSSSNGAAAAALAPTLVSCMSPYAAIRPAGVVAAASHPTTATSVAGAVSNAISTTDGAELAVFDPFLLLNTSALNATVTQAAPGAQRTALRGHVDQFQNFLQAACSVATAGASNTPTCHALQKASGAAANTAATRTGSAADCSPHPTASAGATVGAAGPVITRSVAGAGCRSASGNSVTAVPRITRPGAAASVAPSAPGFLQKPKRVPRESRRPPRRYYPYDMTYQQNCFSSGSSAAPDGLLSCLVENSALPTLSVPPPSASPATPVAPPTRRPSSAAFSAGTATFITQGSSLVAHHQVNLQASSIGSRVYSPFTAAAVSDTVRTPLAQKKPPWRTLTPEQLLLQRSAKKRPPGGNRSSSRGVTSFLKPVADVPQTLTEKRFKLSTEELDTEAGAEKILAKPRGSTSAAGQHFLTETPQQPATVALAAAGAVATSSGNAHTFERRQSKGPVTSVKVGAPAAAAETLTAVDASAASSVEDSLHHSSARTVVSVVEDAERRDNPRRRTRKPSRLSLEAAETHNLTVAFRQQRRSSGGAKKGSSAARSDTITSFAPSLRRVEASDKGNDAAIAAPPAAATEKVHPQRLRRQETQTNRLRANSSRKRHSVYQGEQLRKHPKHPHSSGQEAEDSGTQLISSQQEQAAKYEATLQQQPVFLESCKFTLYPPGFASCPAAVRRVCLSGTLQRPVYVPSATSRSSVQHTLEWQQQDTVAAAVKCRAKFCHVAVKSQLADAGCSGRRESGTASSCNRPCQAGSNRHAGSSTIEGDKTEVWSAAPLSEREEGSVIGFTENSTVSGYIYHWYMRMHVSAQLETQLQQLLEARERLAQQLHDGSEMHSNLFYFSLFPQDYGVEQFKQNLRFFPRYSVASAAAEAAGLQPLVKYGDSSCTSAIAEITRKAKLVEQLYEKQQLQQLQSVTVADAQSQDQQHQQPKDIPPQQKPQQGTHEQDMTSRKAALKQQIRQQNASEGSLTPTAMREERQSGLEAAVPQHKQRCTDLHGAECSATDILQEKVASLLDGKISCKVESFVSAITNNTVTMTSAMRTKTERDGAAGSAAEAANCKTEESFADIRTPTGHVNPFVLPVAGVHQRHIAPQRKECKKITELTEEEDDKEKERANARDEGIAANTSIPQCTSGNRPAASPATAKEDREGIDDARIAGGSNASALRHALTPLERAFVHVDGDNVWKDGDPTDIKKLDSGTHECSSINRTDCNCGNNSAAESVSRSCSLANVVLSDGCCSNRHPDVHRTCNTSTTEPRRDSYCTCSRRSSTHGSSSCDGGSTGNTTDNNSSSSVTSCDSHNTCSSIGGKEEIGYTRSTTVEEEYRSSGSRSDSSRNASAAASRTCVAGSQLGINDTRGATSSSCSNELTDLWHDRDTVSMKCSRREDSDRDTISGSAVVSNSPPHITPCHENVSQFTAVFDNTASPVSDAVARMAPLPASTGSSDRGRRECESGETGSRSNAKAENLAEARYFPIIPRVGTVEITSVWRLIHAAERLLAELRQRQEQEAPSQLEKRLPLLVDTLPDWWMDSVDWSMQQQLTALMLRRVLPGLGAWQGKDLRRVGTVLPFAARGLLALALCQLEHRIAMLQQQLAAAVGALHVLMASVLLLQPVEEYYAPPLYSLPQHVLACLYSRGGGRCVVTPSANKKSVAREERHRNSFTPEPQAGAKAAGFTGAQVAVRLVPSEEAHNAGGGEKEEYMHNLESAGVEKASARTLPSWEAGIQQGAPVAVESFVAYADAFEDYLPTLGKGETSMLSVLCTDSEEGSRTPDRVRRVRETRQKVPRTGAVSRSVANGNKAAAAFESGAKRGRRRKLAAICGESRKDSSRRTGINSTRDAFVKLEGCSTKNE